MVPFEQDSDFVGRKDIIEQINRQFRTNRQRVALFGIGGVGKSQITIEYAHRFKDRHCQIFWVHAANRSRFDHAYQSIAEKLKIPGFDDPQVDTRQLVHKWLNDEDHEHWLLILDNADDTELFFPKPVLDSPPEENELPSGLASYLPRSSKGSILITTRNKILGKDLANGNMPIEIEHFTPEDAEILLKSKVPQDRWDTTDARKLVEVLGCLPLAITQSAAYLSNYNVSLREYLAEAENDELNLKDYLSEELQDPRRELGSPNSVFRTWMLSFNQIRKQNFKASQILSVMALLDRQGVPKSLLRKENDRSIDFTRALGVLQAFSLIKAEIGGDTFTMHRLVQLSTQNWLEMEGIHAVHSEEALKILSAKFPGGNFELLKICEALLPHAQAVLKYSYTTNPSRIRRAELLFRVATHNFAQGRFEDAQIDAMECHKLHQILLDGNDIRIWRSLYLLGGTLRSNKCYEAAEDIFREALLRHEKILGKDNESILECQAGIASALEGQGKYKLAVQMFQQILEVRETRLGMEHISTLSAVYDIAQVFESQGDFNTAEKWYRRASKGFEKVVGELDLRTLVATGYLASNLDYQRKFDGASSLYPRVCAGLKDVFGPDHYLTLHFSRAYSRMLDNIRKGESS